MSSPATTLRIGAIVRIVYGVVALFAPARMFKAFGMGDPDPDVRYFNALFGGRDIVVGLWTLKAVDEGRLDHALLANVGCETTDGIALVQEVRSRGKVDGVVAGAIAFNLVGWTSWIRVARSLHR
jgi:hypothetical protein